MPGVPDMMKFIKRWFGVDKIEAEKAHALRQLEQAKIAEAEARRQEELAKLTPKERATAKGEPWVAVLDTHVNKDNIRNGFFELDWNDEFIVELKKSGYGFDGDPEEQIVDRWFRELAYNMLAESGVSEPDRVTGGYINVTKIGNNRAQVE
jgi:hypothetical protein